MNKRRHILLFVAIIFLAVSVLPTWAARVPDYVSPDGWKLKLKGEVNYDQAELLNLFSCGTSMMGKLALQVARDPGIYLTWAIQDTAKAEAPKGMVLYWGPDSKIVVTDNHGQKATSEACFFSDSKYQTFMYDTRRGWVKVDKSLMSSSLGGISVMVKFPSGSINPGEIREVMVEGVQTSS
jgi:hypothetical protein